MKVTVTGLTGDGDNLEYGTLSYDGGSVVAEPPNSPMLDCILSDIIPNYAEKDLNTRVSSENNPEAWLKSLSFKYKSAYFQVSTPEEEASQEVGERLDTPKVAPSPYREKAFPQTPYEAHQEENMDPPGTTYPQEVEEDLPFEGAEGYVPGVDQTPVQVPRIPPSPYAPAWHKSMKYRVKGNLLTTEPEVATPPAPTKPVKAPKQSSTPVSSSSSPETAPKPPKAEKAPKTPTPTQASSPPPTEKRKIAPSPFKPKKETPSQPKISGSSSTGSIPPSEQRPRRRVIIGPGGTTYESGSETTSNEPSENPEIPMSPETRRAVSLVASHLNRARGDSNAIRNIYREEIENYFTPNQFMALHEQLGIPTNEDLVSYLSGEQSQNTTEEQFATEPTNSPTQETVHSTLVLDVINELRDYQANGNREAIRAMSREMYEELSREELAAIRQAFGIPRDANIVEYLTDPESYMPSTEATPEEINHYTQLFRQAAESRNIQQFLQISTDVQGEFGEQVLNDFIYSDDPIIEQFVDAMIADGYQDFGSKGLQKIQTDEYLRGVEQTFPEGEARFSKTPYGKILEVANGDGRFLALSASKYDPQAVEINFYRSHHGGFGSGQRDYWENSKEGVQRGTIQLLRKLSDVVDQLALDGKQVFYIPADEKRKELYEKFFTKKRWNLVTEDHNRYVWGPPMAQEKSLSEQDYRELAELFDASELPFRPGEEKEDEQKLDLPKVAPSPFAPSSWHKALPSREKRLVYGRDKRGRRYCMQDGRRINCAKTGEGGAVDKPITDPLPATPRPRAPQADLATTNPVQTAPEGGVAPQEEEPETNKVVSLGFDGADELVTVAEGDAWERARRWVNKQEEFPELIRLFGWGISEDMPGLDEELVLAANRPDDPSVKEVIKNLQNSLQNFPKAEAVAVGAFPEDKLKERKNPLQKALPPTEKLQNPPQPKVNQPLPPTEKVPKPPSPAPHRQPTAKAPEAPKAPEPSKAPKKPESVPKPAYYTQKPPASENKPSAGRIPPSPFRVVNPRTDDKAPVSSSSSNLIPSEGPYAGEVMDVSPQESSSEVKPEQPKNPPRERTSEVLGKLDGWRRVGVEELVTDLRFQAEQGNWEKVAQLVAETGDGSPEEVEAVRRKLGVPEGVEIGAFLQEAFPNKKPVRNADEERQHRGLVDEYVRQMNLAIKEGDEEWAVRLVGDMPDDMSPSQIRGVYESFGVGDDEELLDKLHGKIGRLKEVEPEVVEGKEQPVEEVTPEMAKSDADKIADILDREGIYGGVSSRSRREILAMLQDARNRLGEKGFEEYQTLIKNHRMFREEVSLAIADATRPHFDVPPIPEGTSEEFRIQCERYQNSVVVSDRPLGGGCNATEIIEMDDGSDVSSEGIYKPRAGEALDLRDSIKPGTYYQREVAASVIANILGFGDLVPPTWFKQVENEVGSVQKFIPGVVNAAEVSGRGKFDGDEDAARVSVFDFLIGHADRHDGNWMIDKDGKLVLIDNGLAFPTSAWEYTTTYYFTKHAKENNLKVPDLSGLENKWPAVETALKQCGLEEEAIDLTRQRFYMLISGSGMELHHLRFTS